MKLSVYISALIAGIVNSAIGSGGGMINVPAMKKHGLDQKSAQATTLTVILPLTAVSAIIYALNGDYSPADALKYIPFGTAGAIIGVKLTEKTNDNVLKKIFAIFMIWAGIRMLFR